MQLIGMLDSPYVRRVAISLQLLGLPFEHQSISVFRGYDEFRKLNPIVKAPTLICDDGVVLMESTLILDYAEALAAPRSLMPAAPAARRDALRILGLALAACEKSIQIVYEHQLRPSEKLHQPWLTRVTQQAHAAFAELERAIAARGSAAPAWDQAAITAAVAWYFTQAMHPEAFPADSHPVLAALSAAAEATPPFAAAPHGDGVCKGR